MEATKNYQCPNCWGYQEYDTKNPEQQLCECKSEDN
jgi:hypothetical protein